MVSKVRVAIASVGVLVILVASVFGYVYCQQQAMANQQFMQQRYALFTLGTTMDVRWLDSVTISNLLEALAGGQIYEGLLGYDQSGKYVPVLADSLPTISADGLTYTFHLRQGIKFHDGASLTASAVRDNMIRARDDPRSLVKGLFYSWLNINTTRIVDQYTIEFHMFNPFSAALAFFASCYFESEAQTITIQTRTNTTEPVPTSLITGPETPRLLEQSYATSGQDTIHQNICRRQYTRFGLEGS